jgi:DNA-binding CsgD family transcriptional regulator
VHDIGPVLTHREQIIEHALTGKTTSEICEIMNHSPEAVANYLGTFTRSVFLHRQGMHPSQIAYLLGHGRSLIESYLQIIDSCKLDKNKSFHLEELLRPTASKDEKKAQMEVE